MRSESSNWRRWAMCGLSLPLFCCAADRAGEHFRERLPQLRGQSVQGLIDDLGPGYVSRPGNNRHVGWDYTTIGGGVVRQCGIDAAADAEGRIIDAIMRGSDYDCGLMLRDLRKREARYRENPGLREREARKREALLGELVEIRRELDKDPD